MVYSELFYSITNMYLLMLLWPGLWFTCVCDRLSVVGRVPYTPLCHVNRSHQQAAYSPVPVFAWPGATLTVQHMLHGL